MDNNIEKEIDKAELETENEESETLGYDESDEVSEEDEEFETDEEALAELKKFEESVDRSFKNMITLGAILLGVAVIAGIVLAVVL